MIARKKIRIGELLVHNGIISDKQLQTALKTQLETGSKLGDTLIELGYLSSKDFLEFLAEQLRITYVDLNHYQFTPETVQLLPETYARRFRAIVLKEYPEKLLVGMADPNNLFAYDALAKILKKPIELAVVRETDLLRTIDTYYRRTDEIVSLATELSEELSVGGVDLSDLKADSEMENAPVVRLLRTLFEDAVMAGASDIHIEPDENALRIRQRVDGILHEQVMNEKRIAGALVSRLKLMSGLDISEKRLPQDGRFNVKVQGKSIDVRLSTMPLFYGEAVVMRLLDHSGDRFGMEHLGMSEGDLRRFRNLINAPQGMVLVTGPTGSGKTTTLYAAMEELNRSERKIISVEDPIEYCLPRINQVQVNARINLTFAGVLRTALRHDPDIIMVGEMRDEETVEIGLRAAMTGHLVFSTMHTNDVVSTAIRFLDMGAEGYMVASSLRGIIAQRLVRKVCQNCARSVVPVEAELIWLQSVMGEEGEKQQFRKGEGCSQCHNTGYRGRVGIFEILEMDEVLADALRKGDTALFSREVKGRPGYQSLLQGGMRRALDGTTSLAEVIRLVGQVDEKFSVAS
ncbi:MAG: Flp pilus assembly complex ATPase component TadA [Deltaproteobacteria bacterium]|nr:Flp pilus assembly complex ATPase component TadA [Deltaproteobacteria bacterium]